jgi:hypothetical protein
MWQPFWRDVVEEQLLIVDGNRHFGNMSTANTAMRTSHKTWPSLLKESEFLYMNVAGKDRGDFDQMSAVVKSLGLKHGDRIRLNFNKTIDRNEFEQSPLEKQAQLLKTEGISEGEVSTIMALHAYCRRETAAKRKALVYYFHSKGACCSRKKDAFNPVASWREAMNTFNLEFPSICLRALLDGYSTCGFEYQDAHYRCVGILFGRCRGANCVFRLLCLCC